MPEHELSYDELARLTDAQRKEYKRLSSNFVNPPPIEGEAWFRPLLPGFLAGLIALLIFFVTMFALIESSWLMLALLFETPLLAGGWWLVAYLGNRSWLRKRRPEHERALATFVDANRHQKVSHRRHGDATDTRTARQRQHDWYGSHTELDWRDREAAKTFGMTADEWSSNMSGD